MKSQICAVEKCGKEFTPIRANHIYCSIRCKNRVQKMRSVSGTLREKSYEQQVSFVKEMLNFDGNVAHITNKKMRGFKHDTD